MVRLRATRVGGGRAVVPSAASSLSRLGEAIADAEDGLDVLLADLLADVLDVCVDRTLVRLKGNAAYRVQQLRSREHSTGLSGHRGHDLELALGQIDPAAGKSRLEARHVPLDIQSDSDEIGRG